MLGFRRVLLRLSSLDAQVRLGVTGVSIALLGGFFLYAGIRGLTAYSTGVRETWTEPGVCLLGVGTGPLMLWVGWRIIRDSIGHPPRLLSQRVFFPTRDDARDANSVFMATLAELQEIDPQAAERVLNQHFAAQTQEAEAARSELWNQAATNRAAMARLRQSLNQDLADTRALLQSLDKSGDVPLESKATIAAHLVRLETDRARLDAYTGNLSE